MFVPELNFHGLLEVVNDLNELLPELKYGNNLWQRDIDDLIDDKLENCLLESQKIALKLSLL